MFKITVEIIYNLITSGAKSAMWVFSFSKADWDTNIGKYTFSTPSFFISPSKKSVQTK